MTTNVRNLAPQGKNVFEGNMYELYCHLPTGVAIVQEPDGEMVAGHPCKHQSDLDLVKLRHTGKWNTSDITVRIAGFIYNLSINMQDRPAQRAAKHFCKCGVCTAVNNAIDMAARLERA